MKYSVTAIVGKKGEGKTGGEKYDAKLLSKAKEAGFHIHYITWEKSFFEKLMMGLPLLWRLRFITRTFYLHWHLWRSSGDVFIDVWMAPYVSFWAKRTSRRIILMVHHLRGSLEKDKKVQFAEKVMVNAASRILTVSHSSQKQIYSLLGHEVPIDIIPPGFERSKRQHASHLESDDDVHLLFVGHITQAKGIVDLIKALALFDPQVAWHLSVVGSAEAEPETLKSVKAMLDKHGLWQHVQLCGRVADDELKSLYNQADIFVLPSYWEGYGIVFLEAMHAGLPVVSTTAGAIPEVVIDGKTGLLVEPGDIQSLSYGLEMLIISKEKREALSRQAVEVAMQAPDWSQVEQHFLVWWQARLEDVC